MYVSNTLIKLNNIKNTLIFQLIQRAFVVLAHGLHLVV